MGDRAVRNIAPDDVRDAIRCLHTAFLGAHEATDEATAWGNEHWDLSRAWAAFDEGTLCGTARSFASRLRLPGLGDVPVSCLTSVTVLPTHTRRGHLNRMMRTQLEAAVDAGEVASLLIAAEWPIYGRYGYGPCSEWVEWQVDTTHASMVGSPVGSCELVDAATLDKAAAVVLERQQAVTPGSIERPPWFREMTTGLVPRPWEKHDGRVRVVHRDADGEPDAYAMYDPKERWDGMRPTNRIEVPDLVAVSPEAEKELWRYLVDIDLVDLVKWDGAPTSVVRWAMADARAARQEGRWDHIWARLLDIPACLEARAYAGSGRFVLEVVDDFLDRGGRYVLDASPAGASCVAAGGRAGGPAGGRAGGPAGGEAADLTLGVATLGAAWLGGTDLRDLAAGGGRWAVDEHRPGALAALGALLRWPEAPYCSTDF